MNVEIRTMTVDGENLTKQLFLQLKDEGLFGLENFVEYCPDTHTVAELASGAEIVGRVRHPDIEFHNEYALYVVDGELRKMHLFIPAEPLDEIYPPECDRGAVFQVLNRMWGSDTIYLVDDYHQRESMGTRERIFYAFQDLENNHGIAARMAFEDCGTCGHARLHAEGHNRFVFWHEQEEDGVFAGGERIIGTLNIQHSDPATAKFATDTLRRHGIAATWDGDPNRCIEVQEPVGYGYGHFSVDEVGEHVGRRAAPGGEVCD